MRPIGAWSLLPSCYSSSSSLFELSSLGSTYGLHGLLKNPVSDTSISLHDRLESLEKSLEKKPSVYLALLIDTLRL